MSVDKQGWGGGDEAPAKKHSVSTKNNQETILKNMKREEINENILKFS